MDPVELVEPAVQGAAVVPLVPPIAVLVLEDGMVTVLNRPSPALRDCPGSGHGFSAGCDSNLTVTFAVCGYGFLIPMFMSRPRHIDVRIG